MKEYWNSNFYQIEMEGDEKHIHIMGYFYDEGEDNGKGSSRCIDFTWCECPLSEYLKMDEYDRASLEEECKNYIEDMTPEEAIKCMNTYYEGEPPIEMPLDEINMETPCGCYVDWKGE